MDVISIDEFNAGLNNVLLLSRRVSLTWAIVYMVAYYLNGTLVTWRMALQVYHA